MSMLDAMSSPDDLVARAKALEMSAIALTDHGNVFAAPAFVRACKDKDIKPILGCEFYQVRDATQKNHVLVPDIPESKTRRRHITVLARNEQGWKNLMKLQSWSFDEGYYYKPRIDLGTLCNARDGLIVLSGCMSSELSQVAGHLEFYEALELAEKYQRYFETAYNLEISALDKNDFRERVVTRIARIHEETGIPLVITGDVHYTRPEQAAVHAFMTRLSGKPGYRCEELWLKSRDEMWDTFIREWKGTGLKQKTILNAIDRSSEIASQCETYKIDPEHSIEEIHLATDDTKVENFANAYAEEIQPKRLARKDDPDTSKEAATAILSELGSLHKWVLEVVSKYPGKTASELGQLEEQRDVRRIGRRLGELEEMKLIQRGDPRSCTITTRNCHTWWLL